MLNHPFRHLTTALALTVACSVAPTQAASLHTNLIANGNAELGEVSSSEADTSKNIVGWTKTEGNVVILTHAGKFNYAPDLNPDPNNPLVHGDNFFFGGRVGFSAAEQTIDLTPLASQISTGNIEFILSGWIGGYQSQNDRLTLLAEFLDADGQTLSNAEIGPVWASDRNNQTGFLFRSDEGLVPADAESVLLTMSMIRAAGSNNDGMAENLSLVLVPEPTSITLIGAASLACLLRRRRHRA